MEKIEDQQLEEILNYLSGLGFEGGTLKQQIEYNIKCGLPFFRVDHLIIFEDESVRFALNFSRDEQFKSYRLDKYFAELRPEISLQYKQNDLVEIRHLEKDMAQVDWTAFFKKVYERAGDRPVLAAESIHRINILLGSGIKENEDLAYKLMWKYWPKDHLLASGVRVINDNYSVNRDFSSVCHANTAFMHLSKKLDDIYEKIRQSGADEIGGFPLYRTLERELASNPNSFTVNFDINSRVNYAEIKLRVDRNGQYFYNVDEYTVSLTIFPELIKGVFSGVDTAELDKKMSDINWKNDNDLFILMEDDEPRFMADVEEVAGLIQQLKNDPAGIVAYDQLSLKYWPKASYFEDFIRDEAWDYLGSLPKYTMDFPLELPVPAAINLLSGRPVMEHLLMGQGKETGDWVGLKLDSIDDKGAYPFIHYSGFTMEKMDYILGLLQVNKKRFSDIATDLSRGELVPVWHKSRKDLLLEADPARQTINVYTSDMRPIPINIYLDPDWIPDNVHLVNDKNLHPINVEKVAQTRSNQTNKGPSHRKH